MDVKKRIVELMDNRGWSEYRLMKEAGLAASTVANIFHRDTVPNIHTLESICNAFGITLCQFFADGNVVGLSEEQMRLLDHWATLTEEQKQILFDLMSKMN